MVAHMILVEERSSAPPRHISRTTMAPKMPPPIFDNQTRCVNYIWVVTTCIGKTRVPNTELLILDVKVGGIRSSYTEVLVKVAGLDLLFWALVPLICGGAH